MGEEGKFYQNFKIKGVLFSFEFISHEQIGDLKVAGIIKTPKLFGSYPRRYPLKLIGKRKDDCYSCILKDLNYWDEIELVSNTPIFGFTFQIDKSYNYLSQVYYKYVGAKNSDIDDSIPLVPVKEEISVS
nr:hypothetical protein [Abalone asfa-like virus]